jgi:hypothetical protein
VWDKRLTSKLSDRRAVSVERNAEVQIVHNRSSQSLSAVRFSALLAFFGHFF